MNSTIEMLKRKQVATTGVLIHLQAIEGQANLLHAHINARTGLMSHTNNYKRLQEAVRVLKRDVSAEKERVERRLAAVEEDES
jgi:hypothetical protein